MNSSIYNSHCVTLLNRAEINVQHMFRIILIAHGRSNVSLDRYVPDRSRGQYQIGKQV